MRIILLAFSFLFIANPVLAQDHFAGLSAQQILVKDFETGQILYQKRAQEKMPTSSMSKVMTIYMVFEALKEGRIGLKDTFRVSEKAWKKGGSKMFIEVGKRVRVEDLIKGVIVQSGNDATIALAEGISGSEEAFVEVMNEKAVELGMKNSHFMNASGWPDPDHYSTAEDLSILAERIMRDFPEYYDYYKIKEFEYNNINQRNRNPLLFRKDMNVDGIKTGHTEIGGYGLMASGFKNGRRVVLVMNGMDTQRARAQETAKVMRWALGAFENEVLMDADVDLRTLPIVFGTKDSVSLTLENDLFLSLPKDNKQKVKVAIEAADVKEAPVKKGEQIGQLKIMLPGGEEIVRNLVASESVRRNNFFGRIFQNIQYRLFGV